ncbi:CDK5 regulatory subunit-associated protein 2 [Frankliniella fusca]|uniref:CDK5 regulatory subunit-associated protein 2 n=1 Tax=Frankliniella fusca TaxID=407009 RepID=A0AAE1GQJ2_9NEOP|nr:CDK5 regulatory subunit-associated protein 2 [Frankliniella fusca]
MWTGSGGVTRPSRFGAGGRLTPSGRTDALVRGVTIPRSLTNPGARAVLRTRSRDQKGVGTAPTCRGTTGRNEKGSSARTIGNKTASSSNRLSESRSKDEQKYKAVLLKVNNSILTVEKRIMN